MAQEIVTVADWLFYLKQTGYLLIGILVRILYKWQWPPPYAQITASALFIIAFYWSVYAWIPMKFHMMAGLVLGLLSVTLVEMIFKIAQVNEDEIISRIRRWWRSDKASKSHNTNNK
jgi:hypothetical protein